MRGLRSNRIGLTMLLLPTILAGSFGWLTYAAVQREQLNPLLIDAIRKRDTSAVKDLLDRGADANCTADPQVFRRVGIWHVLWPRHTEEEDSIDGTALMVASREHAPDIIQLLLSKGANVNAKVKHDFTALQSAARGGPECVRLLLNAGADVNVADSHGDTPLMNAAMYGDARTVMLLIQAGGSLSHSPRSQALL